MITSCILLVILPTRFMKKLESMSVIPTHLLIHWPHSMSFNIFCAFSMGLSLGLPTGHFNTLVCFTLEQLFLDQHSFVKRQPGMLEDGCSRNMHVIKMTIDGMISKKFIISDSNSNSCSIFIHKIRKKNFCYLFRIYLK